MATLTVTVVSALGTSTKTLTFSATDAQRIFDAWQAWAPPNLDIVPPATQGQMVNYLAAMAKGQFTVWINQKERVDPTPPVFT